MEGPHHGPELGFDPSYVASEPFGFKVDKMTTLFVSILAMRPRTARWKVYLMRYTLVSILAMRPRTNGHFALSVDSVSGFDPSYASANSPAPRWVRGARSSSPVKDHAHVASARL